MRKRIWRMSEDKFDEVAPEVSFQTESLELVGYEKETFESSFDFKSTNDVNIRGMVYSSNPYVMIHNPQFDDTEVHIRFHVTHNGFFAGDVLSGSFSIIANMFQKDIPFSITFQKKYPVIHDSKIKNLDDFAALCKEHYSDALNLFSSDAFQAVMETESERNKTLYRGFRFAPVHPLNLDEFLYATGKKERCSFTVQESELSFYNVTENQKETLHIERNTWGYIELTVRCDADFITVEKSRINSDFFLGNNLELSFYIHKDRLHGGKNTAIILFDSAYTHHEVHVTASLYDAETLRHKEDIDEKKDRFELSRMYVDYRLKKMTTGEWATSSVEILNRLIEAHPDDFIYPLQKAQAFIVNKQRQDALWLISDLKRDITDKKSMEWAYLLYLCTLLEQENSYVNKLTEEVEAIFKLHPEDVRIFWFLLFLRQEYLKDNKRKLNAIKQWVMAGCDSPYLYIEAYQLYVNDAFLLTELSDFSLKILNWAAKHGRISVHLTVQFQDLLPDEKEYRELVFMLSTRIYERYPEKELLFAIVSYLIENSRWGEKYFKWYALAVEKDIKLTGLFEAYIMSLPAGFSDQLPSMVSMFFRYENHLPTEKKALIFANVITYKNNDPHLYEQYIPQIQRFALEQMHLKKRDENLCICYQDILDNGLIDQEIATDLSDIVFTKKIVVFRSDIRRVLVFSDMFAKPEICNVTDHITYFSAVNDRYEIFLETETGKYIVDESAYYLTDMIHTDRCFGRLLSFSDYAMNYYLSVFDPKTDPEEFNQNELAKIKDFLYDENIALSYKRKKLSLISSLLQQHERDDLVVRYLVDFKEYRALDNVTASHIIDLLIISEDYQTAWEMMGIYNGLLVPGKSLLRLLNYQVLEIGNQADDFLILSLAYLMKQYLFTDETIEYLTNFYVGPIPDMVTLWRYAEARGYSLSALEERILTQMLYADRMDLSAGEVFESYIKKRVSPLIVEAYLTYWSRKYLLSKEEVPETVFVRLFFMYRKESKMNESMKLGLLKYLCLKTGLNEQEKSVLDLLLREFVVKNVYFGFYRRMDESLLIKYHFYDKQFVEYVGEKGQNLTIIYQKNDGEVLAEHMIEMYDGIYVKQFLLFFGDSIRYKICPSEDYDTAYLSDTLSFRDVVEDDVPSRFGLINRMKSDMVYKNEQELLSSMKYYKGMDITTKHLFEMM